MPEEHIREQIIQLIHQEVVPAVGCTEPMAVALYTAKTTEMLGCRPKKITALLSVNILKNAMGMGTPGAGMTGLPIAIALGNIVRKSEYQLEVIKGLTPQTLEDAKKYIEEKHIGIQLKQGTIERLYIEMACQTGDQTARAIIAGTHTSSVHLCKDREILLGKGLGKQDEPGEDSVQLSFRVVYDFATTIPTDETRFVLEIKEYNMNAADQSLKGNYDHYLGKATDYPLSQGIFGNSIYSHIIAKTALAYGARMDGAMIPVANNNGSGDQGIRATNPVMVYTMEDENAEEELIRALALGHLSATCVKQSLDKLSALCDCVVASIGSSCGITYLMGDDYAHICHAIKNIIVNLTGMICDGARPGCSLRISSDVSTAVLSALLPMENKHVTSTEGIIDKGVDRSIRNLTSIGKDAMGVTDEMILSTVTNGRRCQASLPNLHLSPVKSVDIRHRRQHQYRLSS